MSEEKEPASSPFLEPLNQFASTLDGIRELLDLTAPYVAEHDRPEARLAALISDIPAAKRKRAVELAKNIAAHVNEELPTTEAEGTTVEHSEESEREMTRLLEELFHLLHNPQKAVALLNAASNPTPDSPRLKLLLKSLLPSTVSAFEVFIAANLTEILRMHPSALGTTEKEFSLEDLRQFGNVNDAMNALIERRVDSFLRDNLDDWVQWFNRHLKVNLSLLALDWDETVEAFHRRHLIVHTGGRVSRQYLQRVKPKGAAPSIGEELPVDEEYLRRAIDRILVLGVLIGWLSWERVGQSALEQLGDDTSSKVYSLMTAGRWDAVRALCRTAKTMNIDESAKHVMRANEWLAYKYLGEFDEVRGSVEKWDISALQPRFLAGKLALLSRNDELIEIVPGLVERGDLAEANLRDWPIFEELRADPRFKQLEFASADADDEASDRRN